MKPLLVMAGGTGGHVYPALAVANLLIARGVRIVWLGTKAGIESRIELSSAIEMEWVDVAGIRGKGLIRSIGALLMLFRVFWQVTTIIRRQRPDALLGMGGYVSGPGALIGLIMRLPLVIHEANFDAGLTNKILARFSTYVLTGFPNSLGVGRKARWVGNPVRSNVIALDKGFGKAKWDKAKLCVLVLGGSQGAEILNQLVPPAIKLLSSIERLEVIHQCGHVWQDTTQRRYSELGIEANIVGYIDDITEAYKDSDIVICRAGAMTISEIAVVGIASVLIPFPHAVGDHQTKNAQFMAERGAARWIPQEQFSSETLAEILNELFEDRSKILAIGQAAKSIACLDATDQVANYCMEVMGA